MSDLFGLMPQITVPIHIEIYTYIVPIASKSFKGAGLQCNSTLCMPYPAGFCAAINVVF